MFLTVGDGTDTLGAFEVLAPSNQEDPPRLQRHRLNLYGYIPQAAEQTRELAAKKLTVPMMAWGGRSSFGSHCIDSAKAIAAKAQGGVIEQCGQWVFQERTDFICDELDRFWAGNA